MKWNYIFLITIFVPAFACASFSDHFNSLLERFFSGKDPSSSEEILSLPEPAFPIIEKEIPTDIKKAILEEEEALAQIEVSLQKNQQELTTIIDEYHLAQYQLEQIDAELGSVRALQEERNKAVKKWKAELEMITRQKSDVEANLRYEERTKRELLSKKFIQPELLRNEGAFPIWQWIFSDKSISQLIEERRKAKQEEMFLQQKVQALTQAQQSLEADEQRVSTILYHVQNLERQTAQQQSLLSELLSARARVVSRLEYSQGELQNALDSARQQQAQSTVYLQNLRLHLDDEDLIGETIEVAQKLAFPLPIEPKITAHFLDPEYKKALNREHYGTDFWAPQGTPILAPMNGTVKKVAQNGYAYSYLILDHGDDLYTLYGHISDALVSEGDSVTRGQEIAATGGTPGMPGSGFFSTGPHLHFEVFAGGRHVDAEKWLDI